VRRARPGGGLRAVAAGLLLALLGAGCAQDEADAPAAPAAPPEPHAALVLEPAALRVGDVAELEIRVVTPPDHALRPYAPPEAEGLWLLDVETLPVERTPRRWLHAVRVRVRPRGLGTVPWPESRVRVEEPDGEVVSLPVEGRELRVVSSLPSPPERVEPFGFLGPREREGGPGMGALALALAAGGGVVVGAAAAGLALRRRGRAEAAAPDAPEEASEAERPELFAWMREALDAAAARAADDPARAAHELSELLRGFLASRFGAQTRARTTPELAAATPPLAVRSRWPAYVALLHQLDELRFRPPPDDAAGSEAARRRLRSLLDELRRRVDESLPPGSGRKER